MEEAPGEKLQDLWDDLSLEQKITIMKDLISLEKRMISVSFNRSGIDANSAHVSIANGDLVTEIYTLLAKLFQAPFQLKSLVTCLRKSRTQRCLDSLSVLLWRENIGTENAQ